MITVVYDYYGIPGSGKSTISHHKAEMLKNEGFSVVEPSYSLDHNKKPVLRKLSKLYMTINIMLRYPVKYLQIKRLVLDNKYTRRTGMWNQIVNICTKVYSIYKWNNKVDYIVFDEGISQASISLSMNNEIRSKYNRERILEIISVDFSFKPVLIELDSKEALKRIIDRNSHDTRVEKLKTTELKIEYLEKFTRVVKNIV